MKENYTKQEVEELINWFKDKELPESLQINPAMYAPDLKEAIENISAQALTNYENPVFNGNMRQLEEIKEVLEKGN